MKKNYLLVAFSLLCTMTISAWTHPKSENATQEEPTYAIPDAEHNNRSAYLHGRLIKTITVKGATLKATGVLLHSQQRKRTA